MIEEHETPKTVAEWAEATFGPATVLSSAIRTNAEMAELLQAAQRYSKDPADPDAWRAVAGEVADVLIVLWRVAALLGMDEEAIRRAVDRKMQINRAREWDVADGHGQHKVTS